MGSCWRISIILPGMFVHGECLLVFAPPTLENICSLFSLLFIYYLFETYQSWFVFLWISRKFLELVVRWLDMWSRHLCLELDAEVWLRNQTLYPLQEYMNIRLAHWALAVTNERELVANYNIISRGESGLFFVKVWHYRPSQMLWISPGPSTVVCSGLNPGF